MSDKNTHAGACKGNADPAQLAFLDLIADNEFSILASKYSITLGEQESFFDQFQPAREQYTTDIRRMLEQSQSVELQNLDELMRSHIGAVETESASLRLKSNVLAVLLAVRVKE